MSGGRKHSSITLDNIGAIQEVLKNLIRIDSQERIERSREKLQDFYKQKREFLKRSLSQTASCREEEAERLRRNEHRRLSAGSRPITSPLEMSKQLSRGGSAKGKHQEKPTASESLPLGVIHEAHPTDHSCTKSHPVEVSISPVFSRRHGSATSLRTQKTVKYGSIQAIAVKKRIIAQKRPTRTSTRPSRTPIVDAKEGLKNCAANEATAITSAPKMAEMTNGSLKESIAKQHVQSSEHSVDKSREKIKGKANCSASLADFDHGSAALLWGGIALRRAPPRLTIGRKFSVNQCTVTVQLRRTVRPVASWRKWHSIDLDALVQQGPQFCRILWQTKRGEEEEEAAEEAGSEASAEDEVADEPESEEERPRPKPKYSIDEEAEQKPLNEAEKAMLAAKKKHEEEEATKLREYEEQRRKQREREEEELKQLKEKQERRRREREEEERIMAERRREEEERRKQEEEERKRKVEEEKRRKEEEKKKRQQMMAGLNATTGPNFELPKKDKTTDKFDKFGNIVKAKAEMGLTKEQQEEQKRKYLGEIMKPLSTKGMDIAGLRAKIKEFHQKICRLEADKYDLEKRGERQDYDLKELNERQRQISRNKALKKGLDPEEAANSRYPPKVSVTSKYERQIDRRSFHERRLLFEVSFSLALPMHDEAGTFLLSFYSSIESWALSLKPTAHPHFPNMIVSDQSLTKVATKTAAQPHSPVKSSVLKSKQEPVKPKQMNIFHGSARPPSSWGRKENEELENLRRNLEPPKYIEQVKVENARPPMEPIPAQPVDVYENGEKCIREGYGSAAAHVKMCLKQYFHTFAKPYDYWIPFFLLAFLATVTNSCILVLISRKRHRKKKDKFTAMFSLGAVLMSATYVFSFAKKFASNCSQKTDQITPKECLLMNPHLFIYPFADYVIMHTSLLSSVDCFWTVACQRRKALFSEKNFNWIFAAVGLAATASVISYTIDVLQRTKEKIQICCLNNLMTSETFIFCYYVVSVSVGLTSVILLIFSAAVYAICHSLLCYAFLDKPSATRTLRTLHFFLLQIRSRTNMQFLGGKQLPSLLVFVLIVITLRVIVLTERHQQPHYVRSPVERTMEVRFTEETKRWEQFKMRHTNICNSSASVQAAFLKKFGKGTTDFAGSKIGVLVTLPYTSNGYYLLQFMTLLYSSWTFIQERSFEVSFPIVPLREKLNLVDLLVFCEPRICPLLPDGCLSKIDVLKADQPRKPTCYHQPTRQFNHNYSNVNSYAFVNEKSFEEVVPHYDYFLRTDVDTFLSPSILNFQMPKNMKIITGKGGYCTEFSTTRLLKVAKHFGLKHQGVHCLGSTWLGESRLIAKLAPIAAKLSMYIFDNEFDTKKYPELQPYFLKDERGTWPYWWRPVSSMYAQELVLNDQIENLTENNMQVSMHNCRTEFAALSSTERFAKLQQSPNEPSSATGVEQRHRRSSSTTFKSALLMPCIPIPTRKKFVCLLFLATLTICTLTWTERLQRSYAAFGKDKRAAERHAYKEEMKLREKLALFQEKMCKSDRRLQFALLSKLKGSPVEYRGSRIGVLLTLPNRRNDYFVVQFMTFVYASWKFIQDHAFEQYLQVLPTKGRLNLVDLLVFCEPPACPKLPNDCLSKMEESKLETEMPLRKPACYYQPTRQFNHSYPNVNSYAFVNEKVFEKIVPHYDYLLRTDVDSFLSPAIFHFQMPKNMKIITGKGGYCSAFGTERLHQIARRLGLTHRGVHCLGSTWFGESKTVARMATLTAPLTMYLFDNEFDTKKYPELLPYFLENIEGTWPTWWRPVSSMYAQELVLNDQIEEITRDYIMGHLLDVESCQETNILDHVHIHTWHSDCDFNKFAFLEPIIKNISLRGRIEFPLPIVAPKIAACLPVFEYCTHVAWSGLALALQKIAQNHELNAMMLSRIQRSLGSVFATNRSTLATKPTS
ncbi:hypothetical protein M514_09885 [Trichuris suis]|uniref:DUF7164 domain-containing protein n=1 Tax=Trichuris suis TaxID=68888 RepID=A0A085N801_9BILA|nr:hypothetical protein M514_09885 [Trichuris suis]